MSALRRSRSPRSRVSLLIEGHASVFGVADQSGDIVRAGAFARSLKSGSVPMLLQHKSGAIAGYWSRIAEDGRGLFVRGIVSSPGAQKLIEAAGLDGLSIGFRPRIWSQNRSGGRTLADIDLVEVSLVSEPMHPLARFNLV